MGNEERLLIVFGSMFIVFIVIFALAVFISRKRKEIHLKRKIELLEIQRDEKIEGLEVRIKKLENWKKQQELD